MPFRSKSQQRWMYANKPSMAKKWSAHTPSHKSLPEKSKKKKKRKEKRAALIALRKTAATFPGSYTPPGGFEEWASWPSIGGSVGGGLGAQALGAAYVGKMLPRPERTTTISRGGLDVTTEFDPPKPRHLKRLKDLLNVYKKVPGRSVPELFTGPTGATAAKKAVSGIYKNLKLPASWDTSFGKSFRSVLEKKLMSSPAYYEPSSNIISLAPGYVKDPHILAHELGHATQRKFLRGPLSKALSLGGKGAAIGGGLGVLGTDDPTKAKGYALLSNAGALPLLGLEAHASGKGSQLMREVAQQKGTWDKLKGLSKLKYRMGAWKGFPTYAMAGLGLPWLTYAIKKSLGGYGKPK